MEIYQKCSNCICQKNIKTVGVLLVSIGTVLTIIGGLSLSQYKGVGITTIKGLENISFGSAVALTAIGPLTFVSGVLCLLKKKGPPSIVDKQKLLNKDRDRTTLLRTLTVSSRPFNLYALNKETREKVGKRLRKDEIFYYVRHNGTPYSKQIGNPVCSLYLCNKENETLIDTEVGPYCLSLSIYPFTRRADIFDPSLKNNDNFVPEVGIIQPTPSGSSILGSTNSIGWINLDTYLSHADLTNVRFLTDEDLDVVRI